FASSSKNNFINIWNESGLVKTINTTHSDGIFALELIKEDIIVTGGSTSLSIYNYKNSSLLANIPITDGPVSFVRSLNSTHFLVSTKKDLFWYTTDGLNVKNK
ncbi:unnamed protein product, partial [Brachionus calyciflorus]